MNSFNLRKSMSHGIARVDKRWLWLPAMLVLAFILFGLLGHFWLPGFAKAQIEQQLAAKLHRPVQLDRVEVQPYALALTLHGLRVDDRPGSDGDKDGGSSAASGQGGSDRKNSLFRFDSLSVNLSSMSLLHRAPVITELTLKNPSLHIARHADGRLSVSDLIEQFSNQPAAEPTRFSARNLVVEGGLVEFDDRLKDSRQTISEIRLGLPFIANFDSAEQTWVQPHFHARINQGSVIELAARARPFSEKHEMLLDLSLQDLDLTGIDEYAPVIKGLRLTRGKLDTRLLLSFAQDEGAQPSVNVSGELVLREPGLKNQAGLPWQLSGEQITLHLNQLDPMGVRPSQGSLSATNVRIKQGEHPELVLDSAKITDVMADPTKRTVRFALDAGINGKGRVESSGEMAWAPFTGKFKVDARDVDLMGLQGWLGNKLNARLTQGALSFAGLVSAERAGDALKLAVQGDGKLSSLTLRDAANSTTLLKWRALDVAGLALDTAPLKVAIDTVSLKDFFGRVMVTPQGRLSLKDLLQEEDGKPSAASDSPVADGTVTAAPAPPSPAARRGTEALPIHIGRIVLQGGRLDFNDRFIKPNYRVNLTGLSGEIGPLAPGRRGQLAVRGAVDGAAPLEIRGQLAPFSRDMYLDITAKANGIDLPTFSPYSGKYVGYAIQKGKLSVDVHYLIEQGELRAENQIFLDQLTFGDKIDSPQALSLPVNLAVALLKNSRGEIDLNLPVSGSLNDPQFSIGGVIFKAFINLLTKAVTAPFALLGSLFGGGADLSQITFAPGYANLLPESEKRLEALSKAMVERPGIKLEITGVAGSASDTQGLTHALLERRLKLQKLAELQKSGKGGSLRELTISEGEYGKYLERAYDNADFDKPKNVLGMNKRLPVAEMERLMLSHMTVGGEELRNLADRRAQAARNWLVENGIAADRIFLLQAKTDGGDQADARVDFSLR